MNRVRYGLLIVAYALLVFIVAFGAFWINDQFDEQHDNECAVATVQAKLAAANLLASSESLVVLAPVYNEAVRQLNEACGMNIDEIKETP